MTVTLTVHHYYIILGGGAHNLLFRMHIAEYIYIVYPCPIAVHILHYIQLCLLLKFKPGNARGCNSYAFDPIQIFWKLNTNVCFVKNLIYNSAYSLNIIKLTFALVKAFFLDSSFWAFEKFRTISWSLLLHLATIVIYANTASHCTHIL